MTVTIRVAQVPAPGAPFEIVEVPVPEPDRGQVRVAVQACGVCHTDAAFVYAGFPNLTFPLIPGHEIAGRVDAIGDGVDTWAVGDRVAVGWFGGNCGQCRCCREGDLLHCTKLQVPGWAYPGGYAEHLVVPVSALARVPDALPDVAAAPLSCAGVTVFNALRHSDATPGDLVAVLGLGGLGHLGVQFATKLGFETVTIERGHEKADLGLGLGAHHVIDSDAEDVAAALQRLGGARVILATAANADAMSGTVDGLAPRGQLMVLGAVPEPINVSPIQLISASRSVQGRSSGTARDVEDTLQFAALTGVRAHVEQMPLDQAGDAFARMMSGQARSAWC